MAERATRVDASPAPLSQLLRFLARQVQLRFPALADGGHALGQEAVAVGVLQDRLRDSLRRQRNGRVARRAQQEAFDGEQRPLLGLLVNAPVAQRPFQATLVLGGTRVGSKRGHRTQGVSCRSPFNRGLRVERMLCACCHAERLDMWRCSDQSAL